jgi:diacylglycerol O-acyltransferase
MKRLGAADKIFLLAERRESPMHVGGLNLFTLPDGADEQRFLHGLADNLRMADAFQHPFGERLKVGRAGLLGPASWVEDTSLDLDYHIRHSALPRPGRYRELFALVSRLHGTLMDRNRPRELP